uniref:Transmembrane protein n=1 Tax=Syphacia muris TaxID=451379 RepID=A0A0N5AY74_9BILA
MHELVLYTIVYFLFALCIVFPPIEFITAGFTITAAFSSWLGDERFQFILYHLKRTVLVFFLHCCLPLCKFFAIVFYLRCVLEDRIFAVPPKTVIQWLSTITLSAFVFVIGLATYLVCRYGRSWESHPTIQCLKKYDPEWQLVEKNINDEYRSQDTFALSLSGIEKVVMTNSWILSVGNYSVKCAQVSDVQLEAIEADEHPISHHEQFGGPVQFVNIEVRSCTKKLEPFIIRSARIRTESFQDLKDKLNKPITFAREVVLYQSLDERFVAVFAEQVEKNPPYLCSNPEAIDVCFACGSVKANVKLVKNCVDAAIDEYGHQQPFCSQCYCRPLWCTSCMARIFAVKQNKSHPERWLQGKAACPTCRSVFCVLDVSPLQYVS